MTLLTTGFEGGTNGAALATGQAGAGETAWSSVSVLAGTLTYDTTQEMRGTLAAKLVAGNSNAYAQWTLTAHRQGAWRHYVYSSAAPAANTAHVWFGNSANAVVLQISRNAAGTIKVARSSGVALWTSTATLPLNQWVRLELAYNVHPTTSSLTQLSFAAYLGDSTTPITGLHTGGWITVDPTTTTEIDRVRLGKYDTAANSDTLWMDDAAHSDTATGLLGPTPTAAAARPGHGMGLGLAAMVVAGAVAGAGIGAGAGHGPRVTATAGVAASVEPGHAAGSVILPVVSGTVTATPGGPIHAAGHGPRVTATAGGSATTKPASASSHGTRVTATASGSTTVAAGHASAVGVRAIATAGGSAIVRPGHTAAHGQVATASGAVVAAALVGAGHAASHGLRLTGGAGAAAIVTASQASAHGLRVQASGSSSAAALVTAGHASGHSLRVIATAGVSASVEPGHATAHGHAAQATGSASGVALVTLGHAAAHGHTARAATSQVAALTPPRGHLSIPTIHGRLMNPVIRPDDRVPLQWDADTTWDPTTATVRFEVDGVEYPAEWVGDAAQATRWDAASRRLVVTWRRQCQTLDLFAGVDGRPAPGCVELAPGRHVGHVEYDSDSMTVSSHTFTLTIASS